MLSCIQTEPGAARTVLARGFGFSKVPATRIPRESLGPNDAYFEGAEEKLITEFGYGPDSGFRLVIGDVSPAKALSLLALHTFCSSDRLDFERLKDGASEHDKGTAYA